MKHRIAIAALATAAALGGAGAVLVPAASASPSAVKSHTITFTSVEVATVNYPHSAAQQDRDVNKAGKVIGYDVLYSVFNPKTMSARINFTAVTNGGVVYGVANAGASPVIHGTVTGGTGIYKGAAGTILARNLNKAGTRTSVTITYHT
jgi:hypothetical protein